jgi:hypothetical protein
MSRKPARARTPREKFIHYLRQMLDWQRLPRESAERSKAVNVWLEQGWHTGRPRVAESATVEGQKKKMQRDLWRFGWREKIRGDAELTKLADEAGVLDKPRPDAQPGDFANPDPRVYKAVVPRPAPPEKEEPRPRISVTEAMRSWGRPKKDQ